MKAALYGRVSTLLGQDPENQLIHLREYARSRDIEVFEEYVDLGISGAKERRPSLDRMIADARRGGKFQVIIIAALDRISRDTRHLLNLLHLLDNECGVSIISLRENLDFSTSLGKACLAILGAISSLERDLCRERIRNALAAKKIASRTTGIPWRCGRPPLPPSIAAAIKELRLNGKSIRSIAKELGIGKSSVERAIRGYR